MNCIWITTDSFRQDHVHAYRPECRKWWAHMKDIMPTHPDNSPVAEALSEVFHLD
ncbi:L-rhamnose mutarotase [bacterium]|nr:L-rhamnose mutarotase [bacterium]